MGAEPLFNSLPFHWEVVTLGEACKRGGGDIQTGPFGSQLHASDYVPVGIPSIMPKNIGENRVDTTDIARITAEDAKRLRRYLVQPGDIVYSRRGDVERRALIREEEDGWLCGTGCLRVRLGTGIDPLYASYYLGHPSVREWIVRHAVGATMPNLNTSILSALPFVIPPLDEQKAIAHILGTLDDKIELNQQMNHTLESIARALFKSWFIDFDPVRAKMDGQQPAGMDAETAALFPDEFEDSALGKIPKGWKVKQLREISNNESESFDFSCHPNVIFLNTGDIAWGQFLHANYSSKDGLPGQAKKAIRKNDILFSEIRPANGRYAFVDFLPTDYVVSTKFMVIRASDEIHPRLLYRVLTRPEILAELQVIADSRSGTFPQITFTSIGHLTLVLPSIPIQSAYQKLVESLDQKAKIHDLETQNLSLIRDALLPKLLSGEIRVKDAEKIVEAVA